MKELWIAQTRQKDTSPWRTCIGTIAKTKEQAMWNCERYQERYRRGLARVVRCRIEVEEPESRDE